MVANGHQHVQKTDTKVFVGECGVCGEMWGNVGFVARPHALRILGSYGKNEKNGKSHLADTRASLSIRKVGLCVKMSVCC
jgi:hypothetical protein